MSKKVLIQGFRLQDNGRKEMIVAFQTESEFSEAEKIASEIQKVLNKVDADNKYKVTATEQ